MEGVKLDYNKSPKVITSNYAQTLEGSDNTMKEQTIGAIALGPSVNLQGGVQFLVSRWDLFLNWNSNDFQILPISGDDIMCVHKWQRVYHQKQY